MDLTAALTNFQQARTISNVQMKVAKKVLDMQRMEGSAALKLLEAAGQGVSKAGDQLAAAATGLGGSIDTYA